MSVQGKRETVFCVAGEASVRNIAEIHQDLQDAYRDNDSIVLDLSGLGEMDLALVQLIEAARRTSAADGKTVALASPANGVLLDTLERGGFLGATENKMFWLHTTEIQ